MFSESAIAWHVTSNVYPPLHTEIVPAILRACANAERGQWDRRVRVPSGMMPKTYQLLESVGLG